MGGTSFEPITPRRASVAPRVLPVGGDGDALPLEDRAVRLLRGGARGVVSVSGPAGSGKTTALGHLAAVLPPDADVDFSDGGHVPSPRRRGLTFVAGPAPLVGAVEQFAMAPWGDDDLIEYLLARHRPQCQAVMFKVKTYAQHLGLAGSPELWRLVLDTMAGDDAIPDAAAALRRCLAPALSDPKMAACMASLVCLQKGVPLHTLTPYVQLDSAACRLVRHRAVQLLLASELIVRSLCDRGGSPELLAPLPHDLILETARLAAHWSSAVDQLHRLATGGMRGVQPMAVSLLVAIRPDWRPPDKTMVALEGAFVSGAHWAGVDLHRASLEKADLAGADLTDADLTGASAAAAVLRDAKLCGAKLDKLSAFGADLAKAQLANASADGVKLVNADLHGADLRAASLRGADLSQADLSDAVLTSAKLCGAVMEGTQLAGADLVGADLSGASLTHLDLTDINLAGTRFSEAKFVTCAMEGISLPHANFGRAILKGCYLTGTTMPAADFHGADLRNAGLADVDWEGADLRDADLRGATFHMGSTRSGLVGSAVPCEGSKTGFYTDDFGDRDFKQSEEIRKANLCGADLRGAKVKGVDFYLVDLRGAHYTDKQAKWFRRCGAILD